MSFAALQDGTQIAQELPSPSQKFASASSTARKVDALVQELKQRPPEWLPSKHLKLILTTCSRLVDFFGRSLDEITLLEVLENRTRFRRFLEERRYRPQSIRTYVASVRRLLDSAEEFGWDVADELPLAWRPIFRKAQEKPIRDMILHLAHIAKSPSDLTEADTDNWVALMTSEGRAFGPATVTKNRLWRLLRRDGHTEVTPVALKRESKYGIPLKAFPDALRTEVAKLLHWKQAPFSPGRPKNGRIRPVSAAHLEEFISKLFGFAVNVLGKMDIHSLPELVDRSLLESFTAWAMNERQVKGTSLTRDFKTLYAAMRYHPSYQSINLSWFKPFVDSIPTEGDHESRVERKARHYLKYEDVASIPRDIHSDRMRAEESRDGNPARLAMEGLLIRFLVTFAWRQRNLRECRVTGPRPNLFKGPIPPNAPIDIPNWVGNELAENPNAEVWQVRFSPDETKTKNQVHVIVPRTLIAPLEEYLSIYRPHLVRDRDPGTLFVTGGGRAFSQRELGNLVGRITAKYRGVRVTPHLFRDILAFAWLHFLPFLRLNVA
jgi:hypothetical protein